MKTIFRINYHTHWGENIYIAGSSDCLGNWQVSKALPMLYLGQGEWKATVETDGESSYEYKYFLLADHEKAVWEGGPNRKFIPTRNKETFIRDFWRIHNHTDLVLLTQAFTSVLLKPDRTIRNKAVNPLKPVVRFNLLCPRIDKGKTLAITGNQKMLGDWNNPVLLDNSQYPFWQIEFDLSKISFPLEYKYVIVDIASNQIVTWEEGNHRIIYHIEQENNKLAFIQNDDFFRYTDHRWKGAGVAVPVFSLRSNESFGVGEFNDLKKLVDWAKKTGLKMIQVLPVNETVATHSWLDSYPYKAISTVALHPMYLNLESLGILKDERARDEFSLLHEVLNSKPYVDYVEVTRLKSKYYKLIFDQEWKEVKQSAEYKKFFTENKDWLEPYAAFCFLRDRYKTGNFREWGNWEVYDPEKIKKLVNPKSKHFEHIAVHYYIQFHLDQQLQSAVDYAHENGIALKGDIPIGISPDSIEAWTSPHLFNLNGQAGAPPDDFAVLGQNWGFPTYNWEEMEKDSFSWWKKRLSAMSKYFDAYRIDHILGFFRIWEIPQHALHGLLGYFKPAMPLTPNQIQDYDIWFDTDRFTQPYITNELLQSCFGEYTPEAVSLYLERKGNGRYTLKPGYTTQKEVFRHFTPPEESTQELTERNAVLRDGLMALLDEVLFIEDPYASPKSYHPRIAMQFSTSYLELDHQLKSRLNELYIDYFYRRHEQFWKEEAMKKLPSILMASNMLVCGEDLGMVPDTVPEVMRNLNILSLEVQRMPKNPAIEFGNLSTVPYLSVCTTSTHDMSTIRGWWEENREKTQRYFQHILGHSGVAPVYAEPWICREIVKQHLNSQAMWCILPIQDLIALDGDLRWDETDKERINVPSDEKNKWRYRMILSLEELLNASSYNNELHEIISHSGR